MYNGRMSDETLQPAEAVKPTIIEPQTTLRSGDRTISVEDIMAELNPHNEVELVEDSFHVPETNVVGKIYTNIHPDPAKKGLLGVITPGLDGRIDDDHDRFGSQPYGFARILASVGLEKVVAIPWTHNGDKEAAKEASVSQLTSELENALVSARDTLEMSDEQMRLVMMTRSFGTQIPAHFAQRLAQGKSRVSARIEALVLTAPTNFYEEGLSYPETVEMKIKERANRINNPGKFYPQAEQSLNGVPICIIQGEDDTAFREIPPALYALLPDKQPKLSATLTHTDHHIGEPDQKALMAAVATTFLKAVL